MTSWQEAFSASGKPLSEAERAEGKRALLAFMKQVRPASAERLSERMATPLSPLDAVPGARLSGAERESGKTALRRFMATHPPLEHGFAWLPRLFATPALAAVVIVALGGSVAYSAEGSVPGSPLYAVKVRVNEPLLSLLYTGEDASALWTVALVERRSEEVRALAEVSDTTDADWATMEDMLERTAEKIDSLQPETAVLVRSAVRERFAFSPSMNGRDPPAKTRAFARLKLLSGEEAVAIGRLPPQASAIASAHLEEKVLDFPLPPLPLPMTGGGESEEADTSVETTQEQDAPPSEKENARMALPPEGAPPGMMMKTLIMPHVPPPSSSSIRSSSCATGSGGRRTVPCTLSGSAASSFRPPSPRVPSPVLEEVPPDARSFPDL